MTTKRMKIGIMPPAAMRARSIAIAKGEYVPKAGEPKVWFPSMESVAQLLSDSNREMLRIIAEAQPESVADAAKLVDRYASNLTRTLKTMEQYGIVKLVPSKTSQGRAGRKPLKPVVRVVDFDIRTFHIAGKDVDASARQSA